MVRMMLFLHRRGCAAYTFVQEKAQIVKERSEKKNTKHQSMNTTKIRKTLISCKEKEYEIENKRARNKINEMYCLRQINTAFIMNNAPKLPICFPAIRAVYLLMTAAEMILCCIISPTTKHYISYGKSRS
jgi:hypothetical protein